MPADLKHFFPVCFFMYIFQIGLDTAISSKTKQNSEKENHIHKSDWLLVLNVWLDAHLFYTFIIVFIYFLK